MVALDFLSAKMCSSLMPAAARASNYRAKIQFRRRYTRISSVHACTAPKVVAVTGRCCGTFGTTYGTAPLRGIPRSLTGGERPPGEYPTTKELGHHVPFSFSHSGPIRR